MLKAISAHLVVAIDRQSGDTKTTQAFIAVICSLEFL